MRNLKLVIILLLVNAQTVWAQISAPGTPPSFSTKQLVERSAVPGVGLPMVNVEAAMREDQNAEVLGIPPRFGIPFDADYSLDNSGRWENYPTGGQVWRLNIESQGALSINLCFSEFWLPRGAELYIYNEDGSHVLGAFTSKNNKASGGFATGLVYGDKITLEYFEPEAVDAPGTFNISRIVHGYRYIDIASAGLDIANIPAAGTPSNDGTGRPVDGPNDTDLTNENGPEAFGSSGACQVNVNCTEGDSWQDQKRSVAMIIVDGFRWCTGSLINTTRGDCTPYFLTADHCLTDGYDAVSNPNMDNWSFYWMYESPTCGGGIDFTPPSTNGATVIANDNESDFALLLLSEDPRDIPGVNPYFAGWDRSTSPGAGGVGIHHPAGDIKKIATHSMTPLSDNWFGICPAGSHWEVSWDATSNGHSVTEGGSSGSPLFNAAGRVIGQLHGGSAVNCANPSNDPGIYGAISYSWDNNSASNSRRRLSTWLDPDGTGVVTTDGTYGSCGLPCMTPAGMDVRGITETTAALSWSAVTGSMSYDLRYRELGSVSWINVTTATESTVLTGLIPCTQYEFQVGTTCDSSTSSFSSSTVFMTDGCPCPSYCNTAGGATTDEWLESVVIGSLINTSGNNGGYIDYTGTSATATYDAGATYPVTLTPGFTGFAYGEWMRVYIDFNADGDFNDAHELAFDAGSTSSTAVSGTIDIPSDALVGSTGMRVMMRWNSAPESCDEFTYGEVEDYCITINNGATSSCPAPTSLAADLSNWPVNFNLSWGDNPDADGYQLLGRREGTGVWRRVQTANNVLTLNASLLNPSSNYEFRVRAKCGREISDTSAVGIFSTPGFRQMQEPDMASAFPNPATDRVYVEYEAHSSSKASIRLLGLLGETIWELETRVERGRNRISISLEDVAPGHYVIQVVDGDRMNNLQLTVE